MQSDDIETDEERYCIQMIRELQRAYEEAANPYFKKLCFIRSLRMTPQMVKAHIVLDMLKEISDK